MLIGALVIRWYGRSASLDSGFVQDRGIIASLKEKRVDLHVADEEIAAKKTEAAGLTKLNIDKLSTQWLQVTRSWHCAG